MIFPYSHRFALAQLPVPYRFKDNVLYVYPLRLRDSFEFDIWLQGKVMDEYVAQANLLPKDEQQEFSDSFSSIIAGISFSNVIGTEFVWKSAASLVHYASLLLRGAKTEAAIKKLFFPTGFSSEGASAIREMEASVSRPLPVQEKLKIKEKKPRYLATPEEDEARIYNFLASKYNFKYQDVLDLTEYQIAWYCHLYPEDREHYEYLDALSNKRDEIVSNIEEERAESNSPGTIHFSSPEAYEQWKRERELGKHGE